MNTRHKEGPSPKTLAVWGGEEGVDKLGATQMPVVNSVSFDYPDLDSDLDHLDLNLYLDYLDLDSD